MSRYGRANGAACSYFFTVVTYRRQKFLCNKPVRTALRNAILSVQEKRPFVIDAWVLLPDHLHCIWTLPPGDADFPVLWNQIKRKVSIACSKDYKRVEWMTESKKKHRESTLWQRRYWEHQIRDNSDFTRHIDYIHFNPVKHGLCEKVRDWPYSTFHRYMQNGIYSSDWGCDAVKKYPEEFGESFNCVGRKNCPPY